MRVLSVCALVAAATRSTIGVAQLFASALVGACVRCRGAFARVLPLGCMAGVDHCFVSALGRGFCHVRDLRGFCFMDATVRRVPAEHLHATL